MPHLKFIKVNISIRCKYLTRLSISLNSLIFTMVENLLCILLYGWIVLTTGQFIHNIKDPSNILSHNSCYGLWPLLTALPYKKLCTKNFLSILHDRRQEKTWRCTVYCSCSKVWLLHHCLTEGYHLSVE